MNNFHAWLLISCLCLGTQACGPEDASSVGSNEVVDPSGSSLFDSEWILIDYKYAWPTADLKNRATIEFNNSPDDVHLTTGKSFVNSYSGSFRIDEEGKLITLVDNIISTKMGGSPEENSAEIDYFKNLMGVKSYELAGDYLTLYFDNREVGYFGRKK